MRGRLLATLLGVVLVAGGLIAWGASGSEGSEGTPEPVLGVGQMRAGSSAVLAQCSDWNEGTKAEKRATVEDIYNQLNQAGADGPTPDLPDDEAYALFERSCARPFATGFRLYKMYAQAAALAPLTK